MIINMSFLHLQKVCKRGTEPVEIKAKKIHLKYFQ